MIRHRQTICLTEKHSKHIAFMKTGCSHASGLFQFNPKITGGLESGMNLQTEVGKLKRVGPRTAELLESRGLYTAGDLLTYYPSRYETYTALSAVSQTEENAPCAVLLTVIGSKMCG